MEGMYPGGERTLENCTNQMITHKEIFKGLISLGFLLGDAPKTFRAKLLLKAHP
jgi:hypothetical protein